MKNLTRLKQHLTSYPIVSDGIDNFESHPFGAKSISLTKETYTRFVAPFTPYLRTPYAYASPYISQADSLADSSLATLESHFPIVKRDTATVLDTTKSYALYPVQLADASLNYVLRTWDDEYQKTIRREGRGPGVISSAMAIVSTELKISSDVLAAVAAWLKPRAEQAKRKKDGYVERADAKRESYVDAARRSVDDVAKRAQEKSD